LKREVGEMKQISSPDAADLLTAIDRWLFDGVPATEFLVALEAFLALPKQRTGGRIPINGAPSSQK
jgi:hypothetical protein